MSNGGYKGSTPARETSPEQYPGVWELTEQFQAQADRNWPFQADDCAPKSLRFNGSSSYLSRTPAAASNRKTWTWSGWVKRSSLSGNLTFFSAGSAGSTRSHFMFDGTDQALRFFDLPTSVGIITTQLFRDTSAWYHLVLAADTTQGTASDRIKFYVNGVQVTSFSSSSYPSQNADLQVNRNTEHALGRGNTYYEYFDGLLSEVHFIDGQALSCEEFGFFDGQGIWQPKRFTGDYSSGPVYSNSSDANGVVSSGNLSSLFDGNTATSVTLSSSNSYAIATQNKSIPVTSTIGMWTITGASYPTMRVTDANGTVTVLDHNDTTIVNGGWTDFSYSGTVAKIELAYIPGSGSSNSFYALRVDGVTLTDATVGRNSFHLDFSDSSSVDAIGSDSSGVGNNFAPSGVSNADVAAFTAYTSSNWQSLSNVFDGNLTTYAYSNANTVSTITFSPAVTGSSIRLRVASSLNTTGFAVNGSAVSGFSGANGQIWLDVTTHTSGSLTSIAASYAPGQYSQSVYGIEVDGALLGPAKSNDIFVDSPVNGNEASTAGGERRGNYATLNPLDKRSNVSLSNGNLDVTTTSSHWSGVKGTLGVNSGKYYFEATANGANANYMFFGICASDVLIDPSTYVQDDTTERAKGMLIFCDDGRYQLDANGRTTYSSSASNGDVISVAFDLDGNTVQFYKNGTGLGTIDISSSPLASTTVVPFFVHYNTNTTYQFNFGQRAFKHPVSGFSPLATSFLPEPTIKRGDEAMDVALWTGNGANQTISNLNLSPDLLWIKCRNVGHNHSLFDVIRGGTKLLMPNGTGAELTYTNPDPVVSFNDDGFELGNFITTNGLNNTHVGWVWDAGDATTTIAAGGLNSSAYNFDQTWSTYGTFTGTMLGPYNWPAVFSAGMLFDANGSLYLSSGTGKWTLTSSIACSSGVKFYVNGSTSITINEGLSDEVTGSSTGGGYYHYFTIPFSGNIASIKVNTASVHLIRIYVDNVALIDSGISMANVPSIASTVRANPTAGFSIVSYNSGSTNGDYTLGHGLNAPPQFIIHKSRSSSNWWVYHADVIDDMTKYLQLNSTNAVATNSGNMWGASAPTSNVFGIRVGDLISQSQDAIAYCWTSVEGFSSIGSFQNPSGDGAFVFCGFKPKLIIAKCVKNISSSSGSGDWMIYDTSRLPFNNPADNNHLVANVANAEDGYYSSGQGAIDILSNGFKIRHQGSSPLGDPGRLYIYAAWAEVPFASQARAR